MKKFFKNKVIQGLIGLMLVAGPAVAYNTDLYPGTKMGGNVLATVANKLSDFASTTATELRGVISGTTGTGNLVFGTSPMLASPVVTGTLNGSISGNAGTATALQTPRNINGVAFDGTADITVPAAAGTLTGSSLASGVTTSSLTTVGTLGNLTVTNPINGSVTGSAASATTAATATALGTAGTTTTLLHGNASGAPSYGALALGTDSVTGALPIANGGTGQTSANAALNALLPTQTGNNGKVLQTNGTSTSWATSTSGSVSSVGVSGGSTGLTTSGGPITTSGTITIAGVLNGESGGNAYNYTGSPDGCASDQTSAVTTFITSHLDANGGAHIRFVDPGCYQINNLNPSASVVEFYVGPGVVLQSSSVANSVIQYNPAIANVLSNKQAVTGWGTARVNVSNNSQFDYIQYATVADASPYTRGDRVHFLNPTVSIPSASNRWVGESDTVAQVDLKVTPNRVYLRKPLAYSALLQSAGTVNISKWTKALKFNIENHGVFTTAGNSLDPSLGTRAILVDIAGTPESEISGLHCLNAPAQCAVLRGVPGERIFNTYVQNDLDMGTDDPTISQITVSTITRANPGVVTTTASNGIAENDHVYLSGGTMTQILGVYFAYNVNSGAHTFQLKDTNGNIVDTSSFTACTSNCGYVREADVTGLGYGVGIYGPSDDVVYDGCWSDSGRHPCVTTDGRGSTYASSSDFLFGQPTDGHVIDMHCTGTEGVCVDNHEEGDRFVFDGIYTNTANAGPLFGTYPGISAFHMRMQGATVSNVHAQGGEFCVRVDQILQARPQILKLQGIIDCHDTRSDNDSDAAIWMRDTAAQTNKPTIDASGAIMRFDNNGIVLKIEDGSTFLARGAKITASNFDEFADSASGENMGGVYLGDVYTDFTNQTRTTSSHHIALMRDDGVTAASATSATFLIDNLYNTQGGTGTNASLNSVCAQQDAGIAKNCGVRHFVEYNPQGATQSNIYGSSSSKTSFPISQFRTTDFKSGRSVTGSTYTVAYSDSGMNLTFNSGSAQVVTLPGTLPVGWTAQITQIGAGAVSWTAGSGATINVPDGASQIGAQYGSAYLQVVSNTDNLSAVYVVTTDDSGIRDVAHGGTGVATLTGLVKGNGTSPFTAAVAGTDYEVPLTFSTGLTRSTNTVTVNTSQNIGTLSNLTSNGLVTTSGGTGALSVTATTGSGNAVLATSPALSGSPTAPTQAMGDNSTKIATDAFVQTALATVNPAIAADMASTANIAGTYTAVGSGIGDTFTVTATGTLTIDGQTASLGKYVLLKDQSTAAYNGLYTVTLAGTTGVSAILTRALDYDQPSDINNTGAIQIKTGTANAGTSWLLTTTVTTIGTDAITYTQFQRAFSSTLSTALTSAHLFVGNSSNIAADVALTGDITVTNAGVSSIAKIAGTTVSGTTGSGNVAFSTSPSLTTPNIGAATATTVNKVTVTAPATGATLTLADNSTLATSGANSATLTTTGSTNVTLPTSGTLLANSNNLSDVSSASTSRTNLGFSTYAIQPIMTIPFQWVASGSLTWNAIPSAETILDGTSRIVKHLDMTNITACRINIYIGSTAPPANWKIRAVYATAYYGSTVANYSDLGSTELSITQASWTTNTYYSSSWVNIAAGAKGDYYFGMTGQTGDGTTNANFNSIDMQCR